MGDWSKVQKTCKSKEQIVEQSLEGNLAAESICSKQIDKSIISTVNKTINKSSTNENALTRNGSTFSINKRVSPHYLRHRPRNRKDKKEPDKLLQTFNRLQK